MENTTTTQALLITGDTYMSRRDLKRIGGKWNGQFHGWLIPLAQAEAAEKLAGDRNFIVAIIDVEAESLETPTGERLGFRLVSHLAFVKNVWGLGRFTRGQHETAFLLAKGQPARHTDAISDVIEWTREPDAVHPNQKPVHALYPLLYSFAPKHGLVLDPFMGSGSTLRAAKDVGLKAVGIEIEAGYCRHAKARLAQDCLFPRRDFLIPSGASHGV